MSENEVVNIVYDYLVKLNEGVLKAAYYFNVCDDEKGNEFLSYIAEGIEWLTQVISSNPIIDLHNETVYKLNKMLIELVQSLSIKDYVHIGDILEYELYPILDNIKSELER